MGPVADAALRLLEAGFLPIPSLHKRPAVSHKPRAEGCAPRWHRGVVRAELAKFDLYGDLGVLADDNLLVVDFDDEATYEAWRAEGFAAEFDATVLAKTRKGYHVWLRRTPLCDELGLNDGPLGTYVDAEGATRKTPMDLKTRTASCTRVPGAEGALVPYYTPGFVAVHPSPNKEWVRSPFEWTLQPISEALARRINAERATSARAAIAGSKRAPAPRKARPEEKGQALWRGCSLDIPCLEAMGFAKSELLGLYEYAYSYDSNTAKAGYVGGTVLQFNLRKGVACPLCDKGEGHDNSYWVGHLENGVRRIKSNSPVCFPRYRRGDRTYPGSYRASVDLPWSPEGLAGWLAAMRARSTAAADELLVRLQAVYQGFTQPRDAFVYNQRLLVFQCDEGTGVVAFGAADALCGYARAGLAETPWSLDVETLRAIPVPVHVFY
jgi:hypothetical protein